MLNPCTFTVNQKMNRIQYTVKKFFKLNNLKKISVQVLDSVKALIWLSLRYPFIFTVIKFYDAGPEIQAKILKVLPLFQVPVATDLM